MIGMDNVSEVLALRIVKTAGLEPPFGPRAKMAMGAALLERRQFLEKSIA